MRKNQNYSKEEMYLAIGFWQKSGLSQVKFCSREKFNKNIQLLAEKVQKEKEVSG